MKTKQGIPVLKLKKFGEEGEFEGYASVFGNRDSYGDIVMQGAFAASLAEHAEKGTMPKLFWQHDSWLPIGSWIEMAEDETGLKVKGRLNMDVQQGREAYALLKAGDIDGLSIGYRVRESDDDEGQGATLLKELDLVEVSVVSLGANDRALVSSFKNIRAGGLPTLPEFEAFLRDAGFSKKEACSIASRGLAQLLRSDSEEVDVVEGGDFIAEMHAVMRDASIIDEVGEPD